MCLRVLVIHFPLADSYLKLCAYVYLCIYTCTCWYTYLCFILRSEAFLMMIQKTWNPSQRKRRRDRYNGYSFHTQYCYSMSESTLKLPAEMLVCLQHVEFLVVKDLRKQHLRKQASVKHPLQLLLGYVVISAFTVTT